MQVIGNRASVWDCALPSLGLSAQKGHARRARRHILRLISGPQPWLQICGQTPAVWGLPLAWLPLPAVWGVLEMVGYELPFFPALVQEPNAFWLFPRTQAGETARPGHEEAQSLQSFCSLAFYQQRFQMCREVEELSGWTPHPCHPEPLGERRPVPCVPGVSISLDSVHPSHCHSPISGPAVCIEYLQSTLY